MSAPRKHRHLQANDHRLSPAELTHRIQHSKDSSVRKRSIRLLEKYLRRGDRFDDTWKALGGASGIAALMAKLSVVDVQRLCSRLGRTASAQKARADRRAGIEELITILMSGKTDQRPLRKFYQSLVPGSHDEVVQSWEAKAAVDWTSQQKKCLLLGHRNQYEQKFLKDIFPKIPGGPCSFSENKMLFRGNLAFSETILTRLISLESDQYVIGNDFFLDFAMPLLHKLAGHRNSMKDELNKFLGLVVECVKQHPQTLRSELALDTSSWGRKGSFSLLTFVIEQWAKAKEQASDHALLQSHLQDLLNLLPWKYLQVHQVSDLLQNRKLAHCFCHDHTRWDLLCIVLKWTGQFRLDLDGDDRQDRQSPAWQAADSWPVDLFMQIPADKSLALLEWLHNVHRDRGFLEASNDGVSILQLEHDPSVYSVDVEIVRTVLQQQLDPSGASWLDDVRSIVQERIKKAVEGKEPRVRAHWAKSALMLCIATKDMAMVHKAFVWARRFIQDPLVVNEVYAKPVESRELVGLLTIMPSSFEKKTAEELEESIAPVRREMPLANAVMIELIKAAITAVREPSFKANSWWNILALPNKIATLRMDYGDKFRETTINLGRRDPESTVAEVLWKPTINLCLDVEALLSDPAASQLSAQKVRAISPGRDIESLQMQPELRVEMTNFYVQAMREKLPETLVTSQVGRMISAVSCLAGSTQPELAIPFIRPIILNSNDSSSHRKIFTDGFLESLSASHAKEFLQTTANTMLEMMKTQNSGAWKDGEQPVIKVTMVKMMADILNGSLVVDAGTSCETLVSLLRESRHIDARIAIITGLLGTLEESTSTPALRKYILDVFEESVLPMASQLNERRPTTEENWQASVMPEVSEEASILKLLIERMSSQSLQLEDRQRLVHIVMDALLASAVNNQRWMALFAEKTGTSLGADDRLSIPPAHHKLLDRALGLEFDAVPPALFNIFRAFILQTADPSANIARITEAVKENKDYQRSDAGKHWLAQCGGPPGAAIQTGLTTVMQLLQRGATSSGGQGRIDQLRQLVSEVAERWIRRGKSDLISEIENKVIREPYVERYDSSNWRSNSIAVLNDLIRVSEALEAEGGMASKLPNVFRLRISVLRLTQGNIIDPMASYPKMVSSLVDRLALRPRPYHNDYELLKAEVIWLASTEAFWLDSIALAHLCQADFESETPSLAAYLRVELIAVGLRHTKIPKHEQASVMKVMGKWVASPAEDLRAMGQELETHLRERNDWDAEAGVWQDEVLVDA